MTNPQIHPKYDTFNFLVTNYNKNYYSHQQAKF